MMGTTRQAPMLGTVLVLVLGFVSITRAQPPITAAAFAPSGKFVVVGSQLGVELRSWPTLKRVQRPSLKTKLEHVHDLAFSPDGKMLAAAGGSPNQAGEVELWTWPACVRRETVKANKDLVYQVSWSPRGGAWAAGGGDRSLLIMSGEQRKTVTGHSKAILATAFLGDGKHLVSAGRDRSLRVWEFADGRLRRTLDNHTDDVRALATRPGERRIPIIASAGADGTVRLWQPTIGRMMRFARLERRPLAIAWTPDGGRLLAACEDGRLRVINPDTVQVDKVLTAVPAWAYTLAVSPDGKHALVGGADGELKAVEL